MKKKVVRIFTIFTILTTIMATVVTILPAPSVATVDPLNTQSIGSSWMAHIPDEAILGQINMPGTHDSGMDSTPLHAGDTWGRTQYLSIWKQLEAGVRYFDLRVAYSEEVSTQVGRTILVISHGDDHVVYSGVWTPLRFEDVIKAFNDFLTAHPSEAIFYTMKEEGSDDYPAFEFDIEMDRIVSGYSRYRLCTTRYSPQDLERSSINILTSKLADARGCFCEIPNEAPYEYDKHKVFGNEKLEVYKKYCATAPAQNLTTPISDAKDMRIFNTSCGESHTEDIKWHPEAAGFVVNPCVSAYPYESGKYYGWLRMDFISEDMARTIYMTNFYLGAEEYISEIKGFCGDKKNGDANDLANTISKARAAGYQVVTDANGNANVNPTGYNMILAYKTTIYPWLALRDIQGNYGYSSSGPSGYDKVKIDNMSGNYFSNGSSGTEYTYLYTRNDAVNAPITSLTLNGSGEDVVVVVTEDDRETRKTFHFNEGVDPYIAVKLSMTRGDVSNSLTTDASKAKPLYISELLPYNTKSVPLYDYFVNTADYPGVLVPNHPDRQNMYSMLWGHIEELKDKGYVIVCNKDVVKSPEGTLDAFDFFADCPVMLGCRLTTDSNDAIVHIKATSNDNARPADGYTSKLEFSGSKLLFTYKAADSSPHRTDSPIIDVSYVAGPGSVEDIAIPDGKINLGIDSVKPPIIHRVCGLNPGSAMHEHNFEISVDGNVLKATCIGKYDCDGGYKNHPLTLTLTDPGTRTYDRSEKAVASLDAAEVSKWESVLGTAPGINYYLADGTLTNKENSGASTDGAAPVFAGEYYAGITAGRVTAKQSFTVLKAKPVVVTPPSAVELKLVSGKTTLGDYISAFSDGVAEYKDIPVDGHFKLTEEAARTVVRRGKNMKVQAVFIPDDTRNYENSDPVTVSITVSAEKPYTGDTSYILLWTVLLLSIAVVTVTVIVLKKRRRA